MINTILEIESNIFGYFAWILIFYYKHMHFNVVYTIRMVYAALLRGINVGGNTKVEMPRLKQCFERAGMREVKTYINSGNVIFIDDSHPSSSLQAILEKAIKQEFSLPVKVLLRTQDEMKATANALPESWTNDKNMKCDVLFLWKEIDRPNIINEIETKPNVEEVRYTPGAVLWSVERTKIKLGSGAKFIKNAHYKKVTVRNCNTVRKLVELMEATKA